MSCDEYKTAFTLENLSALEEAIVGGERRVKYTDKEIEYRSLDDMLKLLEIMRRRLGIKGRCGAKGIFGGKSVVVSHDKGLNC